MTEDQEQLVDLGRKSLDAARVLLEREHYGFAASRAYYTMFYCAQAFLEGEGLTFSKHSATIGAFGQQFAKTGRVPLEFHRVLLEAAATRLKGDYGYDTSVLRDEAQRQIDAAERFLEFTASSLR